MHAKSGQGIVRHLLDVVAFVLAFAAVGVFVAIAAAYDYLMGEP